MKHQTTVEEIPFTHWADKAVEELLDKHPQQDSFVCASGISPSGIVHIGNFREVVTTEFVVRALLDRGKKVRFIYSWDDYDALRKVPANLPNPEIIEKNLRKPLAKIPDPFGQEKSYARQFEKRFENEIAELGIFPNFIYQNEPYQKGEYNQGIRDAIANEKLIIEILNRSRTEPLPSKWTCLSIFCKECDRDTTEFLKYEAPSNVYYKCKACKKELMTNIDQEGGVKLLWRVDWPMRWAKEKVDFEPGGKDHSSQGGSYDTGLEIVKEVWKREAPFYVQYDFVLAKGLGSKLSSSSGNLLTLQETLEVYEPQVIRWIFASRKPNLDFSIAFDLDVMKAYDDFDRSERFAYGIEKEDEKKVRYEKRIYEFSLLKRKETPEYGTMPSQFHFRHLCNILQIHQGDLEKTKAHYQSTILTPVDEQRFYSRAKCAWKWITTYAPEEFRFALRTSDIPKTNSPKAVGELIALLESEGKSVSEDVLATKTFEIMKSNAIEPKVFFQEIYWILIAKKNGPKLASFLVALGTDKAVELLKKSI